MREEGAPSATVGARERILAASYSLFARRGVRGVGVDEVIKSSNVAKATFYKHFPSKDDLVLAYLDRREDEWTRELIEEGSQARGSTPEERLLAIFDVFDEWFRSDDFDGIAFITVLVEMGRDHPLGKAAVEHLANLRAVVQRRAALAGLRDPEQFARSWHILVKGSIVAAQEGDLDAARRAKEMGVRLIEDFR